MNSGQACRPCNGSCSPISGRDCFGDLPEDEIVVTLHSPIVEPVRSTLNFLAPSPARGCHCSRLLGLYIKVVAVVSVWAPMEAIVCHRWWNSIRLRFGGAIAAQSRALECLICGFPNCIIPTNHPMLFHFPDQSTSDAKYSFLIQTSARKDRS